MTLGEMSELIIDSKYGYQQMGKLPNIPGWTTLIFTVELLSIEGRFSKQLLKDP